MELRLRNGEQHERDGLVELGIERPTRVELPQRHRAVRRIVDERQPRDIAGVDFSAHIAEKDKADLDNVAHHAIVGIVLVNDRLPPRLSILSMPVPAALMRAVHGPRNSFSIRVPAGSPGAKISETS